MFYFAPTDNDIVVIELKEEEKNIPCKIDVGPIGYKTLSYSNAEEVLVFDIDLMAQLIQAEAGNQDLTGKRYVADVVLNRVDSDEFPNTVEEVIFQEDQFSVIKNGDFDRAAETITEECYEAVRLEYEKHLNYDILYFSREKSKYATNHFKYQDHWFGW